MGYIKKIFKFYVDTPLILRIFIGLVIGVLLGVFTPKASFIGIFGEIFVGLLKAIAPLLVFVLIISSLSSAGKGLGSRFKTVIGLYLATTFFAAFLAVCASFLFHIEIESTIVGDATDTAPSGLGEVFFIIAPQYDRKPCFSSHQCKLRWNSHLGNNFWFCTSHHLF